MTTWENEVIKDEVRYTVEIMRSADVRHIAKDRVS